MSKMNLFTVVFIMSLTAGIFYFAGISDSVAQFVTDTTAGADGKSEPEKFLDTFTDNKGTISNIQGTVKILRSGSDEWLDVAEKDTLAQGDQIKTDAGASVDVVYDDSAMNVAHLAENTIAEFSALEPTLIYLADGSVFNSLEALPEGQSYEVATDTAVNAVRGTKFLRSFEAANQKDSTVVADGFVEAFSITSEGTLSPEAVVIKKDSTFVFTPDILTTTPFAQIQPQPVSPEHQKSIEGIVGGIEKNLEKIGGGAEGLKLHRDQARMKMEQPEFRQKFQARRGEMLEKRNHAFKALTQENGPIAKKRFPGGRPELVAKGPIPPSTELKPGEHHPDRPMPDLTQPLPPQPPQEEFKGPGEGSKQPQGPRGGGPRKNGKPAEARRIQ